MNSTASPEITNLDLRGLKCPTPVVTTSKAVSQLGGRSAVLRILADDEGFPADLRSWCRATKSELVSIERSDDGVFSATVRVNNNNNTDAATPRNGGGQAGRKLFDFRGQRCPEPIIQLAKEVRQLQDAGEIEVLADDDSFPMDVKSWCRSAGATLISVEQEDSMYRAVIQPRLKTEAHGRSGQHRAVEAPRSRSAQHKAVTAPSFEPSRTEVGTPGAPVATPRVVTAPTPIRSDAAMYAPPPGSGRHPAIQAAASLSDRTEVSPPPARMTPPAPMAAVGREDAIRVDLSSMPSMAFRQYLESLDHLQMPGAVVAVLGRHDTFAQDIATWCARRAHTLLRLNTDSMPMVAEVALVAKSDRAALEDGPTMATASPHGSTALVPATSQLPAEFVEAQRTCTLLVLHNDLETLLAALMTANAAQAGGMQVNVFFAFWGINVLRADAPRRDLPREKVSFMQRMFKRMMPKGPNRQRLGKLSFGGMGGKIMMGIMRKKNIMNAQELLEQAVESGVTFIACTTSMAVMGVTKRDLVNLPNIQFAGVTSFVDMARGSGVSLVF